MNRAGGLLGRIEPTSPPLIATAILALFTVALTVVAWLGLPTWSLLVVALASLYVILVLLNPTAGLLAVTCVFFVPVQVMGSITLLHSVGAVTAALLLIWFLYQQRKLYLGNVLVPFLLLGVLILVSVLYARDVDQILRFFRKWVFNMMYALLLVNLVTRFEVFKKVVWAVLIMAVVNSAVAMYDYATAGETYYRSSGLLGNANYMGHLAALAFPLALFQYLYAKGVVRWIGLGLAGLLVGGVVASVSRGATFSLIVVFCAICVLERRKFIPLLLVLALMISAGPFLPDYYSNRVGNLATDVWQTLFPKERETTSRGYLLSAGFKIWASHPVLGVGLGNFGIYYVEKEFNPGNYRRTTRMVPHNIYTQAFAEMGVLGGTLLFWLLGIAVSNIIRARRSSRHDPDRWLYFGAVEMMALAVMVSFASSGSLMMNEFWLFICLTALSGRVAAAGSPPAPAAAPAVEAATT